jgi:hypothetical protein
VGILPPAPAPTNFYFFCWRVQWQPGGRGWGGAKQLSVPPWPPMRMFTPKTCISALHLIPLLGACIKLMPLSSHMRQKLLCRWFRILAFPRRPALLIHSLLRSSISVADTYHLCYVGYAMHGQDYIVLTGKYINGSYCCCLFLGERTCLFAELIITVKSLTVRLRIIAHSAKCRVN